MYSFKPQEKKNRSLLYRVSAWLHLWLGLLSGIIVFIVSVTGAIYTFKEEIEILLEPFQTVEVPEHTQMLPPSKLSDVVVDAYDYSSVYGVYYRGEGRSAMVPYYSDPSNYQQAYVNPYTGEPLYNRYLNNSFFRFIIEGHYNLWLPRWIGIPLVSYGTLVFVILLLSGLVLWWPKRWNKRSMKKSFTMNWKSNWRRINYDLHNVIGFYSLLIALILGLTGMVFGLSWFEEAVYWTASGGEQQTNERVTSDTTLVVDASQKDQDILFRNLVRSGVDMGESEVNFIYPRGEQGVWNVSVNPSLVNSYQSRSTYYEQHSLKELKKEATFSEVNGGEKLSRLNYDLHVGSIGGIWTKIIAFLVCIVSASLPVTGFIFWFDRERRQQKKKQYRKKKTNRRSSKGQAQRKKKKEIVPELEP